MAEEIGISYSYIRKIMKEVTGKSLSDLINSKRVEEAKILTKRKMEIFT
jgi:transcriptional regulator, AraC family